jgi:type 1 fimbria pilin
MTVSFAGPCITTVTADHYITPDSAIVFPTCSIDAGSKNITVELPLLTMNQFSAVGSTADRRAQYPSQLRRRHQGCHDADGQHQPVERVR